MRRRVLVLPGFYRPTKEWDMLTLRRGALAGALGFKSHVGPSSGNDFNNRSEEVMGQIMIFGQPAVKEHLARMRRGRFRDGSCSSKSVRHRLSR